MIKNPYRRICDKTKLNNLTSKLRIEIKVGESDTISGFQSGLIDASTKNQKMLSCKHPVESYMFCRSSRKYIWTEVST